MSNYNLRLHFTPPNVDGESFPIKVITLVTIPITKPEQIRIIGNKRLRYKKSKT